MKWDSLIWEKG